MQLRSHGRWLGSILLSGILLPSPPFAARAEVAARPPELRREFRGVWVASVGNIDWPSRPGLSVAEQQAELLALLDQAAGLKMNAILLQVRPACDALYASKFEPWSEYLTGRMGQPPAPFYDPLAFAIDAAHQRGLELHAWFNPYRAHHFNAISPIAPGHVSRTRPELVRKYGRYLWLDPGEPAVQDYSLSVVLDVVRRYDVDGIHFDDYFYPYEEKDAKGGNLPFPDEATWQKYGVRTGLSRGDWRRENVNRFIQRVDHSIHTIKPWVKFGVSPFGIWRPGHPPSIKGFDAYARLYADARKWLMNGWMDYCVPQLYWSIDAREQSFPVLLDWWNQQNPLQRHIWPGMDTTKTARQWKAEEILAQIRLAARQPVSAGHVHWNAKSLMKNSDLKTKLVRTSYAEPALIPAMPWLGGDVPPPPLPTVSAHHPRQISWSYGTNAPPALWIVQARRDHRWRAEIFSGKIHAVDIKSPEVEAIAITAVGRTGKLSTPAVLRLHPAK